MRVSLQPPSSCGWTNYQEAVSSWSTSRQMEVARPKSMTLTQTWRLNSSPSTTFPLNPANGSVSTRTCCPFRGEDGIS
jgi:hypothetical protein